ncbi:hypothetical protein NQZ79_g8347 [Umbelopsis isabellina]|nr:hypothetical protein NQZ79_g8347 [Umbelopsis isabellina]
MSDLMTRVVGEPNTLEYRIYFEKNGVLISTFHDIPLFANAEKTIFNMIVENPRWANAKLEISREETLNPIKQDIKKGKLRFVRNCFPYKGYIWNYGAFPQTWENPNNINPETKARGDNDPIDVCEIGEQVAYPGQIKQVKVLGTICLLDEGDTDWKIIAIDIHDPLASKVNSKWRIRQRLALCVDLHMPKLLYLLLDIEDVEKYFPGLLRATNDWFRIYKIPDGNPENEVAFDGKAKNNVIILPL